MKHKQLYNKVADLLLEASPYSQLCPNVLPPAFQESYVWKMYQERCWDFFPAGDCFRKQYEDQLG